METSFNCTFGTKSVQNPNCDNDKCTSRKSQVRILPISEDANIILCRTCFEHEIAWRKKRFEDGYLFVTPTWESLKVYN